MPKVDSYDEREHLSRVSFIASAFVLISWAANAGTGSTLQWKQTWGQNAESNATISGGPNNPPVVYAEPAAYASQGHFVVVPTRGPFIWEEYHHDIPVFSNAAYFYSWQNGAKNNYPWGQPVFYCNQTQDSPNVSIARSVGAVSWALIAPIDASVTQFQVDPARASAAALTEQISINNAPVYIRIDDEIMRLVSYNAIAGSMVVLRGQLGSIAAPHTNTNASSVSPTTGRFSYICQHPYVGDGINPPTALNQIYPNFIPDIRHPFGGFAYDSTHDVIWIMNGAGETFHPTDTFSYCYPGSTSAYCAGKTLNTAMTFITSNLGSQIHAAAVWDPDEKVLAYVGGQNSGQRVQLLCVGANPLVGCINANKWNLITDGKATSNTYVSNPTSGPQSLLGMSGVYDTAHRAFIFWGGGLCPLSQACAPPDWSTVIYILKFNYVTNKWAWIVPMQLSSNGLACSFGTNCPSSDIHPVFTWDSKRSRVLDVSPVNGATYEGRWDGGSPGTFVWNNLNVSNGPTFNFNYCNGTTVPAYEPQGCLDWPYGGYWAAHDAIIMVGAGKGIPTSMAAWELDMSGTSGVGTSCDLNSDGTVNILDVQSAINQVLGQLACTTADLQQNGQCNVVDVQRVISAALGGPCVIGQ